MKDDAIVHVLWSKPANVQLMLEIYRQCCRLSITYDETIKQGVQVFKELFWVRCSTECRSSCSSNYSHSASRLSLSLSRVQSPTTHADVAPSIVEYRKFFLQQLKTIFTTATPAGSEEKHIALCKEVLELFKQLFLDLYDSIAAETSETLMYTVLDITTTLLDGTGNKTLADNLAALILDVRFHSLARSRLLVSLTDRIDRTTCIHTHTLHTQTVLFIWIRTKTRKVELWKALQDGVFGIISSPETIPQCKLKILQLTWIIRDMIYPIKQKKKKPVKRPDSSSGKVDPAKTAMSLSPDSVPQLTPCAPDPKITNLDWTVDDIVYVWMRMLRMSIFIIHSFIIHSLALGY